MISSVYDYFKLNFVCLDDSNVSLNAKNYLSLDWHPRAKPKFFNEKAAEDFVQHESYHGRATPKKQVAVFERLLGCDNNTLTILSGDKSDGVSEALH